MKFVRIVYRCEGILCGRIFSQERRVGSARFSRVKWAALAIPNAASLSLSR
jgi:hypothetical protein